MSKQLDKPKTCIICTESLNNVDTPLRACGHWLHLSCVKKHFKPECPICRAKLNIKVTGTKPHTYIPFSPNGGPWRDSDNPRIRTVFGIFLTTFRPPLFQPEGSFHTRLFTGFDTDGYTYAEEHPNYDEENPRGDNWDYGD